MAYDSNGNWVPTQSSNFQFGPGPDHETSQAEDEAMARASGAKQAPNDYSQAGLDKQKAYNAWAAQHAVATPSDFNNSHVPSADYGGTGGVDYYRNAAKEAG